MDITVIDGQGGGIGKTIIERIRSELGNDVTITALGTNVFATSSMLKAGADKGATGENAIKVNSMKADLILGPLALIIKDSLLGEITGEMVAAVSTSKAQKILLPLNKCGVTVIGTSKCKMVQLLDEMMQKIKETIKG